MALVFLHYLERFVTLEKKTQNKHAFLHYLKQFGILEKFENTRSLKHTFCHYLQIFGTAETI